MTGSIEVQVVSIVNTTCEKEGGLSFFSSSEDSKRLEEEIGVRFRQFEHWFVKE